MNKLLASLVLAFGLSACGAPVEEGSAEDVEMQQQALGVSGKCLVDALGFETGDCLSTNRQSCGCWVDNATGCVAGRKPAKVSVLSCNGQPLGGSCSGSSAPYCY